VSSDILTVSIDGYREVQIRRLSEAEAQLTLEWAEGSLAAQKVMLLRLGISDDPILGDMDDRELLAELLEHPFVIDTLLDQIVVACEAFPRERGMSDV
jgi:hypothetical protein